MSARHRGGKTTVKRRKGMAVFLDRDGVLNEEVGPLYRKEQLRLLPGAVEGIRRLNERGIPLIVATNQPAVARGLCTEAHVAEIHQELRRMLADRGARLDAIYYCPCHELATLPEYRRSCVDRKPNIGMLSRAAARFGLDLARCYVIGDRTVDIQTGVNAGCRTVLVRTGYGGTDAKYDVTADFVCDDLRAAAAIIVGSPDLRARQRTTT
jgi:histidinol-phosphate phosphatase family protein